MYIYIYIYIAYSYNSCYHMFDCWPIVWPARDPAVNKSKLDLLNVKTKNWISKNKLDF